METKEEWESANQDNISGWTIEYGEVKTITFTYKENGEVKKKVFTEANQFLK